MKVNTPSLLTIRVLELRFAMARQVEFAPEERQGSSFCVLAARKGVLTVEILCHGKSWEYEE